MVIPYIFISFCLGIIAILFFRRYDLYEKEPVLKMAIAVVVGGVTSIIITSAIYFAFTIFGIKNFQTSLGALFIIGPTEEISKLVGLYIAYLFIKKEMNEPVDGLIYMSCVALGFSLIENFSYALIYHQNSSLIFTRFLLATPAHILFSVYMGLAFYYHKKIHSNYPLLIIAFLYGAVLHGVWDLLAFNGWWFIFFILILYFARNRLIHWLDYTTAKSPFRISLVNFILEYKNPQIETGLECINCGSKNDKETYHLEKIIIQKCDQCSGYVSTRKSMFLIFHYFGAKFERLSGKLKKAKAPNSKYYSLFDNNLISKEKKIAFFNSDELNETLENLSLTLIKKSEKNENYI